jgi:glutathione synthase/RimK-type ligase-like ATP-grasp enzyme
LDNQPFLCNFLDEVKEIPKVNEVDIIIRQLRVLSSSRNYSDKPVLILTRSFDPEADLIGIKLLSKGVDFVRLNLEDIPSQTLIKYNIKQNSRPDIEIQIKDQKLNASKVSLALLRHFDITESNFGTSEPARTFSFQQWQIAFQIFLNKLKCKWVNNPYSVSKSKDRIVQLLAAKASGFDIPHTIVTNDPDTARNFYYAHNRNIVIKALHNHSVELDDKIYSMYTHSVTEQDLPKLTDLIYAPCILQEKLEKKSELRITVVGNRAFAAKLNFLSNFAMSEDIHRCSSSDVHIEACEELQSSTIKQCIKLIKKLGLRFGAIDFLVDKNDRLIFLEVNPAGDWYWIEKQTRLPITNAVVDLIEKLA